MPESCLNCQHLPNPEPLRMVRKMVASGPPQPFQVTVDNSDAREEIVNFLGAQGYSVQGQQKDGVWYLDAKPLLEQMPDIAQLSPSPSAVQNEQRRTMIMLLSDKMGQGDDALGAKLMYNFVASLGEFGTNLWRITLMNSAVRLATYNSPVLQYLQQYEKNGSGVLLCKECVYHYNLQHHIGVGTMFEMSELVTTIQMAEKVLRF